MANMFIASLVLFLTNLAQAPADGGWREPFPGVERPRTVPFRVGGSVSQPGLIRRVEPSVSDPRQPVLLELIVNEDGAVWRARVVSGPSRLVDAALDAVRQWRFAPTVIDGLPSPVTMTARVGGREQPRQAKRCAASAALAEPVRVGSSVSEAHLLHRVEPDWPQGFPGAGEVVAQVSVNERGEVYEVRILRGDPALEEVVTGAVCQWLYSPRIIDGAAVAVIAVVSLRYNLAR
jgi:hypothetical protein